MPPELLNLLTQIPLVAVFVWFVLEWNKRNQEAQTRRDEENRKFLEDQRDQDRKVTKEIANELHKLAELFAQHERKSDAAIALMMDRSRQR